MPATAKFADAPVSVPLPPRQAPSESDHHKGSIAFGPPKAGAMPLISGIMVATNGMLSMTADRIAEIHRMIVAATTRLPPVSATSLPPTSVRKPLASTACTATNKPMKKKIVAHSISAKVACT